MVNVQQEERISPIQKNKKTQDLLRGDGTVSNSYLYAGIFEVFYNERNFCNQKVTLPKDWYRYHLETRKSRYAMNQTSMIHFRSNQDL